MLKYHKKYLKSFIYAIKMHPPLYEVLLANLVLYNLTEGQSIKIKVPESPGLNALVSVGKS